MPENQQQPKPDIVTRKMKQRFLMPDGSVKEVEVIHRRRKADDDRMQYAERARKKGDPTAGSTAINLQQTKSDSGDNGKT